MGLTNFFHVFDKMEDNHIFMTSMLYLLSKVTCFTTYRYAYEKRRTWFFAVALEGCIVNNLNFHKKAEENKSIATPYIIN